MVGVLNQRKSNVLSALLRSSGLLVGKILAPGTYKVLSCIGLLRSTHCTEAKIGTRLANAEADEIIVVPLLQGALRKVSRSPLWREQINVEVLHVLCGLFLPGALRTLRFYHFLTKLGLGYAKTSLWETRKLKSHAEIAEVWSNRHGWGAQLTKTAVMDLSGFYLKVAQVFATKADLLPKQYIVALSCVLDDCDPMSVIQVKKILESEWDASLSSVCRHFEEVPIGSATIAQVHKAITVKGECVAIKVQNLHNRKLMRFDMSSMLFVSRLLDKLHIFLPFDHTSILVEYSKQVPLEFDFFRERRMLSVMGQCIRQNYSKIHVPVPIEGLCTARVLTMTFAEGDTLASYIHTLPVDGMSVSRKQHLHNRLLNLIECFGYQLFTLGIFHSDPHPGNILFQESHNLALLDFGQVKILPDETRILFAHLVIALHDESDDLLGVLRYLNVHFTTEDPVLIQTIASILFDTRMDLPEARLSPLDPDFPPELRAIRINSIPTDVFMIVRVVAIFRGIFAATDVDIHARKVWIDDARKAVADTEVQYNFATNVDRTRVSQFERLKYLSEWLADNALPHKKEQMVSMAKANLFSVTEIARAAHEDDETRLAIAFSHFSLPERRRCLKLCMTNCRL